MTCQAAFEGLSKRADGRLALPLAAALDAHVASCPACRERAEGLDWVGAALHSGRRAVPAGFAGRVLQRTGARSVPPLSARVPLFRLLPLAATFLLVAGLAAVGVRQFLLPPAVGTPQVQVELELAQEARSVAVAGDFNGWAVDASRMTRGPDGVWRIRLALPPGRYQYVFIVDDEQWIADPHSTTVVDNGYSGTNSVLDVSL